MTLFPRWFVSLLSRFAPKKPRRLRCLCGHIWKTHTARGCAVTIAPTTPCPCRLDRFGKPARQRLVWPVKDGAA